VSRVELEPTTLEERHPAQTSVGISRRPAVLGALVWTALILVAALWGRSLNATGHRLYVDAPPLTARIDPVASAWAIPAVVLALATVALGPWVATRLRWRLVLLVAAGVAAAWAGSLALARGPQELIRPLLAHTDYLTAVETVSSPGNFLAGFTDRIGTYPAHVRAHPPGMVVVLWGLARLGLSSPGWAAALLIAGGAAAVPAVLIAVRTIAGEARARAAAPFVALAPTATAVATSADALFAGVGAWAVTLVVLAVGRADARAAFLAAAGGVLFGMTLLLTYGGILFGVVAAPAIVARRPAGPAALAATVAVLVVLAAALFGFWWPDGLAASVGQYEAGVSRFRPYPYFLIANLAAFAVVLGPATAAGLASLRHRGTWLLVGGGVLAVLLADLSGLSKGEVERIWLPFAPWMLLSAAALPHVRARAWLGANAITALAIAAMLRTPW
jgi:hypothetical protein